MVNEHYVPQSYLRLFSPEGEGLISRYSLVEKHPGGDYRSAYDKYSINNAASIEGFASGWLEQNEVNRIEDAAKQAFEKLHETTSLNEDEFVTISQFVTFQAQRTPPTRRHFDTRQRLGNLLYNETEWDNLTLDDGWEEILIQSATRGQEQLQHMGWLFVENNTDIPFITSDEPGAQYFDEEFEAIDNPTT